MDRERAVLLTAESISLLLSALDSHLYWSVTPTHLRRDGHSQILDAKDEPSEAVYSDGESAEFETGYTAKETVKHAQEVTRLADRLREASR